MTDAQIFLGDSDRRYGYDGISNQMTNALGLIWSYISLKMLEIHSMLSPLKQNQMMIGLGIKRQKKLSNFLIRPKLRNTLRIRVLKTLKTQKNVGNSIEAQLSYGLIK